MNKIRITFTHLKTLLTCIIRPASVHRRQTSKIPCLKGNSVCVCVCLSQSNASHRNHHASHRNALAHFTHRGSRTQPTPQDLSPIFYVQPPQPSKCFIEIYLYITHILSVSISISFSLHFIYRNTMRRYVYTLLPGDGDNLIDRNILKTMCI